MRGPIRVLIILFSGLWFLYPTFAISQQSKFSKSLYQTITERININNIDLALENNGNYGVYGTSYFPNGTQNRFLWSGGIGLSAYDENGKLRVSWLLEGSKIIEFQPGKVGADPDAPEAKFYIVRSGDGPGSQAYEEWATAVALGADFVDKNSDGVYDPNIDAPDLLGDQTIWCVFNDEISDPTLETHSWSNLGVEIYQTVFAYDRDDEFGDMIFIRYRIKNVGNHSLDSVIFSVLNDPDIGSQEDDLPGCDTTLNLGFAYNDGYDNVYGEQAPAYGVTILQGPLVYSPGDTGYRYLGPQKGIIEIPDQKNLGMTSFLPIIPSWYYLPAPFYEIEARRYMEGGMFPDGNPINPADFLWGSVNTTNINPRYIFSGNPVSGEGWLPVLSGDISFILNSGQFNLGQSEYQDVIIALAMGQGTDPLESVQKMKENVRRAKYLYNRNFPENKRIALPPLTIASTEHKVRISLNLEDIIQKTYLDLSGTPYTFQGIAVYQYKERPDSSIQFGGENEKLVAIYDIDDPFQNIYVIENGDIKPVWLGKSNISRLDKGLLIELDKDAFQNDQPLISGKTYYYSVVAVALAENRLKPLDSKSWLADPTDIFFTRKADGFFAVTIDQDQFKVFDLASSNDNKDVVLHLAGNSEGIVNVLVTNPDLLTGHTYHVKFFPDKDTLNYLWRIYDVTTDEIKVDSIRNMASPSDMNNYVFPIVDGIMVRVFDYPPTIDTVYLTQGNSSDEYFRWNQLESTWNNVVEDYSWKIGKLNFNDIELIFDTSKKYVAHLIALDTTYKYLGDTVHTYVAAYDISDPDHPRQVNILFPPVGPTRDLDMHPSSIERCFITVSDYSENPLFYPLDPNNTQVGDAIILFRPVLKDSSIKPMSSFLVYHLIFKKRMTDNDIYEIRSNLFKTEFQSTEITTFLDKMNVVPNPYWLSSAYETSGSGPVLHFTNIPGKGIIRIFTLAGQLVKTISVEQPSPTVSWDLRNHAGKKVASGIYIAHISIEGYGTRILKFAIIQRR